MKVLLLQDVKSIGRCLEVKDVSDGYARNFLFPRKLAVPADATALKTKAAAEAQEKSIIEKYQKLAARLIKEPLEFKVKTGPKNEVFGAINKEAIKKNLSQKGFGGVDIFLSQPIKKLGEQKVAVNFGRGVKGEAKIILKPE